jgi:pyridinium-3,5-bisthiocarboxylic acid mononucleotide nickel chelatase
MSRRAKRQPAGPIAWFHCFSGIAGDMALGALVDAGADLDEVRVVCQRLPVGGWTLEAQPVLRCGIAATKIHVRTEETTVVRTAGHIAGLIEEARLPDRVRDRALAAFGALAEAEGKLHRRPPSQVHFHEVGSLDAILDVVGTCAALEVLDVAEVHSSAVATGVGMHRAVHGLLPSPAPAVVELLRGAPTYGIEVPFEMATPTGAALLAATVVSWGPLPAMVVRASGFGAGARELEDRPNVTQVVLGDPEPAALPGQPVILLETNVDDATGEVVADAVGALLEAGAQDAWVTNILMKKGRPAHKVSALVDPSLTRQVADAMTRATGSLGVRGQTLERWPQARQTDEVEVAGHPVRVKVSAGRVKVEHDDASYAARRAGLPVREVISLAEEAWRRRGGGNPDEDPPQAG